jgi:acetyl-CoA carboxylase carboxyltransferase component
MNDFLKQKIKKITESAFFGGGNEKIERQKKLGKKTARERIDFLLDPQSFEETSQLVTSSNIKIPTDGVVTGFGTVYGKQVAIFSQDFTVKGGSLGKMHAEKICKIMDIAAQIGCPIIGIIDSGGARIDEGIHALRGYEEIFARNVKYSGVIPQISLVLGPCAGGAVYSPALTDFIFVTKKISNMFITGPQVIKEALHEEVTKEELGGTEAHSAKSGVAHFVSETEEECFSQVQQLLSYLPSNYLSETESVENNESDFEPNLESILPSNCNQSYNIKQIIDGIVDIESFFEVQESFAPNIVVGLARFNGTVTGIVANQPQHLAGSIDINASCKAARFIRCCDSFDIPIVSLVDIPGFLAGVDQEHNGIIRHGAKLLYAYAEATVPKITLIIRKAFGGGYIVMGSKGLGADFNFAWPTAQIAVLGAKAAVTILHGRSLSELDTTSATEERVKKESEYSEQFLNPITAAEHGYIDAIIEPNKTRSHIIRALEITKNKVEKRPKRKHGNCPL